MQDCHDWRKQYTPATFHREFGLEFKGPGFYLSKTDTLLVVPLPPDQAVTLYDVWNVKQPEGTIYSVSVFNTDFARTIFAAIAIAPVRYDAR